MTFSRPRAEATSAAWLSGSRPDVACWSVGRIEAEPASLSDTSRATLSRTLSRATLCRTLATLSRTLPLDTDESRDAELSERDGRLQLAIRDERRWGR